MKKLVISLLLVLFAINVYSQNVADSLQHELLKASSDTSKIIIMLELADDYFYDDVNKFQEYFYKAKALLDKVPFKRGTAYYYYIKGLTKDNAPIEALENFNTSLQLYTELKDDEGIAFVNLALGAIYVNQSEVDKAMPYFVTALKIYQSLNDNEGIGVCYSNIGSIYNRQKKYKTALNYSKKALNYFSENDHSYYGEYVCIAYNYSSMGEEKIALQYYDSIIGKLKQKKYFDLLSNVYTNMGIIHENKKNEKRAMQLYKLAYDMAKETKDNYYLMGACLNISDLFIKMNQPDSVITLLQNNLSINTQLNSQIFLKRYYENMASAYEIKGDVNSALTYYKLFKSASDSLISQQSDQRLYELQTSFEVNQKDEEIESLNKENRYKSIQLSKQHSIIILTIFSALLFIIAAFVSYNRFRLKRRLANMLKIKNEEIKEKQQEIMVMNDMLEKQNESLLELDNMKTRFFTNISHEFRTPLSLIIGPLADMHEKAHDDETKRGYRLMLKHAYSLLNLINQLLDLSKLQKAGFKLQISYNDINSFLHATVDSFVGRAGELNITLTYHSTVSPLYVWFDRDKLEKIVVNIISNALKHTPKGGFVEISLSEIIENPDYIEIIVCDTGIGIESHEIKNIFDPFYQSDATINRKIEGSGIGLALVKELVELHGGSVAVNSEVGKGTQFTVRIAVGKRFFTSAEILTDEGVEFDTLSEFHQSFENIYWAESKTKIIKNKPIILVVEDNNDMRKYISKSLLTDYQIVEATNGKEGFEKALEVIPDLIISDIMMPIMNGYEMTRHIKNNQLTSHIPVIILTSKASEESKIKGLEAAADEYLIKPFNTAELILRIKNTLSNRQKLRDKFQKCITVNPSEITTTSLDEQFLTKALQIIENHLAEEEYSVSAFCSEIGMSKTHVYRKLKALTNQSFTEFVRCIRLKRAISLLMQKSGNLTEIAYRTGFSNLSYFSRSFKKQFGVSPSEYINDSK